MLDLRKIGVGALATSLTWATAALAQDTTVSEQAAPVAPADAALSEAIVVTKAQMQVLEGLGWLMIILIAVFALLLFVLQRGARSLANTDDAKARYYALPFGVPEGTVRGMVAILIIVLGIAVLTVQRVLAIESGEAIASFVGAVIAFYFVTREQAQTRGALEASSRAMRDASAKLDVIATGFVSQAGTQGLSGVKSSLPITVRAAAAVDPNLVRLVAQSRVYEAFKHKGNFTDATKLGDGGLGIQTARRLRTHIRRIARLLEEAPELGSIASGISLAETLLAAEDLLGGTVGGLIGAIATDILDAASAE